MEGQFEYGSGHVLYWDAKEGAYYDRGRDMYVEDEEIDTIMLQQGRGAHRGFMPTKAQRMRWMREFNELMGDPQPKSRDYWDNAAHLFHKRLSPTEAAQKLRKGARAKTYNEEKRKKQLYSPEPFNYAEPGDRVKVHLNLGVKWKSYKIKTWSVKDERASVTLGHARRVVLKNAVFHVGQSGAKRALGGEKTVHAWVDGTLVSFMLKSPAKRSYKTPATAIKLRYNPHLGHTAFMRQDKNGDWTIPVASAKKVFLDPDWGVYATGVVDQRKQRGAAAKEKRFSPGDLLLLDSPHTRGMPGLELQQVNYRGPMPGLADYAVVILKGQQMTVPMEWLVKPWGGGGRIRPSWGKPRGGAAAQPDRSTVRLYQGILSNLEQSVKRGFAATATASDWQKEIGGVTYVSSRSTGSREPGFYVGTVKDKHTRKYRGGIGPFKTTYEATMAIWHMEQSGVRGQRAKSSRTPREQQYADQYGKYLRGEGRFPKSRNRAGVSQARMEELRAEVDAQMGLQPAGRSAKSSRVSKCVSFKVREEGWTQRQAVAACQNMNRSKRLRADGSYIPKGRKR